jgi:hypothetical protein
MACELSILPDKSVVLSNLSGPTTIDDRVRNRAKTLEFARENNVNRVLLDMRRQESLSSTVDIHDFAATIPKITCGLKIAVVYNSGDAVPKFIETVAKNRGAFIKGFHCFDRALDWLVPPESNSFDNQDSKSTLHTSTLSTTASAHGGPARLNTGRVFRPSLNGKGIQR